MKNRYSVLCATVLLQLTIGTVAYAQNTTANPPAVQAGDIADYSLKGSVPKAPGAATPPTTANAYELSGTSISGAASSTGVILTAPVGPDAAPYKTASGVYFYPTAFVGFGYNDNVRSAATNVISSSLVNVSPQVIAELKNKGDRYTLLTSLNAIRYANSPEDNFTNSEFEIAGDNYFTSRARAGWSVGQVNGSDPRGATNFTASADIDRWHSTNLNGRLIYGAVEAKGRIEVDLAHQAKTYDNNREVMAVADVTVNSIATRGYYRLGTRTQALAEFRQANANYASSLSTDSNIERRYYAGLTWEASAATTGVVKIGQMTKDFNLDGKAGFSGGSWEASLRWVPLSYSAFDLRTSRATADSTGFGNYNLITNTDLSWNHKWTRSLSSRVAVGVLNTEYVGTSRTDTANSYSFSVDYAVLRWLKLGVDFASTDNNSSVAASAYKRNVSLLTLNASL